MAILPPDYFIADFPDQVWDGLTGSPKRYHPLQFQTPDGYDFAKISAEVQAIEKYLLEAGTKISTVQRTASEPIAAHKWVELTLDNEFAHASNLQNTVAGILLHSVNTGEMAVCLAYGLITLDDWTVSTGEVLLTPGKSYFLAASGQMSLAPPPSGHIIKVGRATSDKDFVVDVAHVVKLN